MGQMILLIAATRQGKTTKAKELIAGKPCFVFDVNGEYDALSWDANEKRSRFFNEDFREFLKVVPQKHGGTICVFEEATNFFSGGTLKATKSVIVGKAHPVDMGGRALLFIFHSIASVPPFLFDNADYIVLGKTGDTLDRVKQKRDILVPYYLKLRKAPKYTFFAIKNI